MVAQYAIAAALDGLVIGTDHAAEAGTGFFTKFGDGGVDANPLAGLTKRQVRALAEHLGVPARIVTKAPTADLESLRPQVPDEEVLGLSHAEIDDFLEGIRFSPGATPRSPGATRPPPTSGPGRSLRRAEPSLVGNGTDLTVGSRLDTRHPG